jgi:hypothetical protein
MRVNTEGVIDGQEGQMYLAARQKLPCRVRLRTERKMMGQPWIARFL